MKATGIVRRIDDLGRIVIPKEIRKTMHVREGDPLELYICENGIMFRKYKQEVAEDLLRLANDADALDDFPEENKDAARLLLTEIAEAAKKLEKLSL